MPRSRPNGALRPVHIQTSFLERRPESVLYCAGASKVLCTSTLVTGVPPFLEGKGTGWATAEYDLLPASTSPRHPRERGGRISGRTQEIQRIIGRSLRGVLDLKALEGFTLEIDCDVLQADGSTRTAAINGAFIALSLLVRRALASGLLKRDPIAQALGAVSVGMVDGTVLVDLDYEEDSSADVDLNLVLTESGDILEIQGTSEASPFGRKDLESMLDMGAKAVQEIILRARQVLDEAR